MNERVTFLGVAIWLLALLFFFYEFFLRIFLGTIAADLSHQLHLSAGQFSTIGAGYYITYGIMQVPVGLLIEKVGARLILPMAALFCALGVFFLSLATGFWLAFFSRLLIGFGSSFAFVSLLLLILKWFPKRQFSLMAGLSIFLGAIGPLLAGGPLALLYSATDNNWRGILVGAGVFGLILCALLALFVRNQPDASEHKIVFVSTKEKISDLTALMLKNKQVWATLIYSSMTYVALPLFAAYFGTLLLQSRGIPMAKAASIVSMQWIGYAIGSPLLGKLSDRFKKRKPFLIFPALMGVLTTLLILYLPTNNEIILISLFMLMGIGISGQTLTYAAILENVPRKLHSSALGFNNTAAMLSSAIMAIFVGGIIQAWGGQFSTVALTRGLSLIPCFFAVAFFVSLFGLKETFCRQQHEIHVLHKYSDILG